MSEHLLLYDNLTPSLTTYVVAPCHPDHIEEGDHVKIMRLRNSSSAVLVNIRSNTERDGRGTVLLQAAVTWARKSGLNRLTGKMITSTPERTREWYEKRGVGVDGSNILSADLNEVLGLCAAIMANRGDSYRIQNLR